MTYLDAIRELDCRIGRLELVTARRKTAWAQDELDLVFYRKIRDHLPVAATGSGPRPSQLELPEKG